MRQLCVAAVAYALFSLICNVCSSFVITPKVWDYNGHSIGYDEARSVLHETEGDESFNLDNTQPILLLNGFGVGSFHQHRLMEKLLQPKSNEIPTRRAVYGIDYLGQGRSWPHECNDGMSENEYGLIYSGDTWMDQIIQFIEQVILPEHPQSTKVHVVGNSLGGHLTAFLAAYRQDLVESVCLLNPTPIWGLNLPGWSGHLPAPVVPKWIGRYLFDQIRDVGTINQFLEQTYANREAYSEKLVKQIRKCTEGKGGHAAFASILWAPPVKASLANPVTFYDCLSLVECDVLLMFGKDDPWCKPVFAKKMLKSLSARHPTKVHRYIELSDVGHCPNHEAPQAVAQIVSSWVDANNRSQESLALLKNEPVFVEENWGGTMMQERHENEIDVGVIDRMAMVFI